MTGASASSVERPIVFRSENVRAILSGRKTQARRLVELPLRDPGSGCALGGSIRSAEALSLCPYGRPGDHLWVRETIACEAGGQWYYAADRERVQAVDARKIPPVAAPSAQGVPEHTYPSSYMPRWAARLILKITDVRLQHLQEITIQDAVAEGPLCWACGGPIDGIGRKGCVCFESQQASRASYVMLWERLHEESAPWASNPLIWAISFRPV